MTRIYFTIFLIISATPLYGQSIEEIVAYADTVCGHADMSGGFSRESVIARLEGDVNGHLKLLGDLSLKGEAISKDSSFLALRQEILSESLQNYRNCKLQVVQLLLTEKRKFETALKTTNYAVMDVYYATDRKEQDSKSIKYRYGTKRGNLSYGVTQVSIPRDHRMGELESPSILKLEFREDPEKHIVLLDIENMPGELFYKSLSTKVKNSEGKNSFIFIHGYNVTFEDAARRTGQIAYDLGFNGVPVFYSWPSQGDAAKYPFDEANIEWAQTNIEKFISDFADKSNSENIYLIAHSMGNRALTQAYISAIDNNPSIKKKFKEIILAAPDIDADVFVKSIAPKMKEAGNPITLYASSEDVALKASKSFHGGYRRAGDSNDGIIITEGIESIDSTNVETGFLGHSYYADERSIISDTL